MSAIEHSILGRHVFVKTPAPGDRSRLGVIAHVFEGDLLRVDLTRPGRPRSTRLHRLDEVVVLPTEMLLP